MRRYSLLLLLSCALAACAVNPAADEEAMMIKAAELTKLSTAVEASVRYEAAQSAGLDDAALLKFASRDDAELLKRFAGLTLRVARADRHAAVLVCSADGRHALLEDAGCTLAMDRHAWREADSACEFRLDLSSLCAVRETPPLPKALPADAAAPAPAAAPQPRAAPKAAAKPSPVAMPVVAPAPPAAAPVPESVSPAAAVDAMPMATEAAPMAVAVEPPEPVVMARSQPVPLIEVAGVAWAREINRDSKRPVATISQAAPGQRLVLWMAVQGSDAALNQLAASGKLPLRHKWFRETISGIRPEGVALPVDEIEIPVARAGLVAKLRQEVRSLGHFNWRTWSFKEKPGRGNWRVTLFYSDNTPVLCSTPEGHQPCEYAIEVR